jgi:deoxycytidylate deaminase
MNFESEEMPRNCNERQQYYLKHAAKVANKSEMEHKHGAILVHNDTIIGSGFNHKHEHMCHKYSIHAEVDALLKVKAKKRHILQDAEMYVVRIGNTKLQCPLKYSRPCCDCQKVIQKYGIKKVYYSTNFDRF